MTKFSTANVKKQLILKKYSLENQQ